jgi:hypothetical protein
VIQADVTGKRVAQTGRNASTRRHEGPLKRHDHASDASRSYTTANLGDGHGPQVPTIPTPFVQYVLHLIRVDLVSNERFLSNTTLYSIG